MPHKNNEIVVSTDNSKLDVVLVHEFLTNSYWASGRTFAQVKKTIENTFCFGIYLNDEQIGFARVLTDKVVFAYVTDLFIIEKHRGKGYSKILMEKILSNDELTEIELWFLATKDSHGLYKQFEFTEISKPEMYLIKEKNRKIPKWYTTPTS